jgi:hypothetical protein
MINVGTKAVLLADAAMFLVALLLGVWKYSQIASTEGSHLTHLHRYRAPRGAAL